MNGSIEDYMQACDGFGPLAQVWSDKPHRLVYDLCREIKELQFILDFIYEAVGPAADDVFEMAGEAYQETLNP